MSQRSLEAPIFFTSASRVKIPFVGDDTRKIKLAKPAFYPISNPLEKHQNDIASFFVKSVSNDIKFDKEVVTDRCAHTLSYKDHDKSNLYNAAFVTGPRPKKQTSEYLGRFDTRGFIRKPPSHLKKLHLPNASGRQQVSHKLSKSISEEAIKTPSSKIKLDYGFSQPIKGRLSDDKFQARKLQCKDWDESILDKLSKETARWIVFEASLPSGQREKLNAYLQGKYGEIVNESSSLDSELENVTLDEMERKKKEKQKQQHDIKQLESRKQWRKSVKEDAIFQKTLAEYYRLPRYLRQQRSNVITTSNQVNQTAQKLNVKHYAQPPPPSMQDFMNKAAGKYINASKNAFEQQLYTGQAKPVHQKFGDRSRLIMDDLSEYQVEMIPTFPTNPSNWVQTADKERSEPGYYHHDNVTHRLQRWSDLPKPADFMSERGLNPPKSEETRIDHIDFNRQKAMIKNMLMITVVEEWRSKWKLAGRWQEMPISDILLDMNSIHDHIRLGAVAACAMASLHRKPINEIASLAVESKNFDLQYDSMNNGHLPDTLIEEVEKRLGDSNERVCLAAAICLYSLQHENQMIISILKDNISNGYSSDCLAAAQCLALFGDTTPDIICMLIDLLMEKNHSSSVEITLDQREQATMLLIHISSRTRLVHSLLAEQLNSGSWKERVIACQVLAKLAGNINQDLVHKLTNLMWHDWSSAVRKAAAETLGRTGHGRHVHFELREKLAKCNERVRVDVLNKVSHLGIMTATLLPSFMKCFSDSYVSVRIQACKTVGKLRLSDDKIIAELLRLMQYDPSWRIKAHAIKAIGEIGLISGRIQEALIWALRFEDEAGVRMEASKALRYLNKDSTAASDILHVLQDRVLVEPDPVVKEEVRITLEAFGMCGPEDNMDMIQQIKNEVRRLCQKGVIAAKITLYEKELKKYQNKAQYLGTCYEESDTSEDSRDLNSSIISEIQDALVRTERAPDIVVTPVFAVDKSI